MVRMLVRHLKPGMVADTDIYSEQNVLLFQKGVVLTGDRIAQLIKQNVLYVLVEEKEQKNSEDKEEQQFIKSQRNVKELKQVQLSYKEKVACYSNVINEVVTKNTELNTDYLVSIVDDFSKEQNSSFSMFEILQSMKHYDDATFVHSFNVALICELFARWIDLGKEERKNIILSGILHDIGKLMIPDYLIKKPAKLTEEEYQKVKQHPQLGYDFLKKHNMDEHICNAAWMHHERVDGKGYPRGLTGSSIDQYAKIVSIADVYDAMTADRVYRKGMCPFTVLKMFEEDGLSQFDPELLIMFMQRVATTYIKSQVLLDDGRTAQIIMTHKEQISRPLILCEGQYIDLRTNRQLHITEIK